MTCMGGAILIIALRIYGEEYLTLGSKRACPRMYVRIHALDIADIVRNERARKIQRPWGKTPLPPNLPRPSSTY